MHDHPGKLSDAWYAVKWPAMGGHVVGRLDLGLIEMVLTIPLAVAFAILWRRKPFRPLGFYTGIMCTAYAPVRFLLDFLREDERDYAAGGDPRYGGLTPAQWACFGLFALGIYFLRVASAQRRVLPSDATTAVGPAAAASEEAVEPSVQREVPTAIEPSSPVAAARADAVAVEVPTAVEPKPGSLRD